MSTHTGPRLQESTARADSHPFGNLALRSLLWCRSASYVGRRIEE